MSKQHIAESENKGLIGTARYTSINSHKGLEQSRRDDLESLGYVLLYFLKGELPWQDINCDEKELKFDMIKNMKINYKMEDIAAGSPPSFWIYFQHIFGLKFMEQPNYEMLK